MRPAPRSAYTGASDADFIEILGQAPGRLIQRLWRECTERATPVGDMRPSRRCRTPAADPCRSVSIPNQSQASAMGGDRPVRGRRRYRGRPPAGAGGPCGENQLSGRGACGWVAARRPESALGCRSETLRQDGRRGAGPIKPRRMRATCESDRRHSRARAARHRYAGRATAPDPCADRRLARPRAATGQGSRRRASLCWSSTSPVNAAALAVRETIVERIAELAASGTWTGITLRADDSSLL